MKDNESDDDDDDIRIELNPEIPLWQHLAYALEDKSISRDERAVYAAMVVGELEARNTKLAELARLVFNANYPGLLRERAKTS